MNHENFRPQKFGVTLYDGCDLCNTVHCKNTKVTLCASFNSQEELFLHLYSSRKMEHTSVIR